MNVENVKKAIEIISRKDIAVDLDFAGVYESDEGLLYSNVPV